jgi:hypothetical protein
MPVEITQILREAYAVAMGSNEEATRSGIVKWFIHYDELKHINILFA